MADAWLDPLSDTITGLGLATYSAPVSAADALTIRIRAFGPYDQGGGNWQFSKGLGFETPADATPPSLYAITSGTIRYEPGQDDGPGTVVLTRTDALAQTYLRAVGTLPHWYPVSPFVVYKNVDPATAKQAALASLARKGVLSGTIARIRRARSDPHFTAMTEQLTNMWLNGDVPDGLPVLGGDLVGAFGISPTDGKLFAEVRMVDALDSPDFYNPSYYLAQWNSMGWLDDTTNILLDKQVDTSGPAAGNGKLLFVGGPMASETPPFETPDSASSSINAAIDAARDGDTILILDHATYDEIVMIEKPISITSASNMAATADPPPSDYPVLDGEDVRRPVTIQPLPKGIVHLGRVEIRRGRSKRGGGIRILTDYAVVSSCILHDCHSEGVKQDAYLGGGFGGAILADLSIVNDDNSSAAGNPKPDGSSPLIIGCLVENNASDNRGAGIASFGYGWPAIFVCRLRNNTAGRVGENTADGGGLAFEVALPNTLDRQLLMTTQPNTLASRFDAGDLARASSNRARITGCVIDSNTANDDGGGVYLSVMANVLIRGSTVKQNHSQANGGGIRVTLHSELRMVDCMVSSNVSNFGAVAFDEHGVGGGGISSRNASLVTLERTDVSENTAQGWSGGGLSFVSGDEGRITEGAFADYNDILIKIYGHRETRLEIDVESKFDGNNATHLQGQQHDHGKGGALYALRWNGNRSSGLGPLQGPWGPNGQMVSGAAPIAFHIVDIASLAPSNTGSFPQSSRIYVDDLVTGTPKTDADLPVAGNFDYP